jgi:hypothetical protein
MSIINHQSCCFFTRNKEVLSSVDFNECYYNSRDRGTLLNLLKKNG